jgi:hypothetical protein
MTTNSKPWIATIYFYLISAICVITMIFSGIQGLQGLYSTIDPESNLNEYEWQAYSDIDTYKRNEASPKHERAQGGIVEENPESAGVSGKEPTDLEWQQRWDRYRANLLRGEVLQGRRMLVYLLMTTLICLPLFLLHWRFARKSTGI